MRKKQKPNYHFRSLFEEWIDYDKNKRVVVGRTSSWSGDGFSSTDYEVRYNRQNGWRASDYDQFCSNFNCQDPQFLPRFQKYGLEKGLFDVDFRALTEKLEMSSVIETIYKADRPELLRYAIYKDSHHNRYWPQVKMAIRHKYKIKDVGIWYDYLSLLSYFRKDLNNPKFACPTDLKTQHDKLVAKKRKIQRQEDRERELNQIARKQQNLEKAIATYQLEKANFLNLEFVDGDLTIKVLQTVTEFKEEGDELRHCVYTNAYYDKKDSLVLSARINGKRVETIEVLLSTLTISQARGLGNNNSAHHTRILELMKNNMRKIKEAKGDRIKTPKPQQHNEAA